VRQGVQARLPSLDRYPPSLLLSFIEFSRAGYCLAILLRYADSLMALRNVRLTLTIARSLLRDPENPARKEGKMLAGVNH